MRWKPHGLLTKRKELETAAGRPATNPNGTHVTMLISDRQTYDVRCEVVRNIGEAARQQQILHPEISQATPGDP